MRHGLGPDKGLGAGSASEPRVLTQSSSKSVGHPGSHRVTDHAHDATTRPGELISAMHCQGANGMSPRTLRTRGCGRRSMLGAGSVTYILFGSCSFDYTLPPSPDRMPVMRPRVPEALPYPRPVVIA